jgi:cytosine/adenosine deaminase-related metal-dependent hydrolase
MGSLDIGKDADILFFRIPDGLYLGEHSLSQLCFSSEDFLLAKVLVDGVNRLGS